MRVTIAALTGILGIAVLQALPDGSVPRLARMLNPYFIAPKFMQSAVVVPDPPSQTFALPSRCAADSLLVVLNTGTFFPGIDYTEGLDPTGSRTTVIFTALQKIQPGDYVLLKCVAQP